MEGQSGRGQRLNGDGSGVFADAVRAYLDALPQAGAPGQVRESAPIPYGDGETLAAVRSDALLEELARRLGTAAV